MNSPAVNVSCILSKHSVLALQHTVHAQFSARASACCLGGVQAQLVYSSDGAALFVYVGPWWCVGKQLVLERCWAWIVFLKDGSVEGINTHGACMCCLATFRRGLPLQGRW